MREIAYDEKVEPKVVDLDYFFDENLATANDRLCAVNYSDDNIANPYAGIPFDISQFKKRSLVTNPDFLLLLSDICNKRGVTIRSFYGVEGSDECDYIESSLDECYIDAVEQFRKDIASDIYKQCMCGGVCNKVGVVGFEQYLIDVIAAIKSLPDKYHQYVNMYEVLFKYANQRGYQFVLRHIEKVIARIARSDGEVYWLDKDVSLVFVSGDISMKGLYKYR